MTRADGHLLQHEAAKGHFLSERAESWMTIIGVKDLLVQYLFRFGLKWPMYKWSHIGIFQIRVALEILLPCIQRLLLSQRVWKEDSAEKEHTDRDHRRTVPPRRGLPVEESPSGGCSWRDRRDQDNAKIPGSCGLTALPGPCLPQALKLFRRQRSRVEICRDHHDRRSCKMCADCVIFSWKQREFLHNLRR